jgi:hypothetical protein
MSERASALNAHKQLAWSGGRLQLAERASEFTAAGRRAGLPNELHPNFELAEPMAVPNLSSNPFEVNLRRPKTKRLRCPGGRSK